MNCDEIQKEIAALEVEADMLWQELKRVEAEIAPHIARQDEVSRRWSESFRALDAMKMLLARTEKRVLTDGQVNG